MKIKANAMPRIIAPVIFAFSSFLVIKCIPAIKAMGKNMRRPIIPISLTYIRILS